MYIWEGKHNTHTYTELTTVCSMHSICIHTVSMQFNIITYVYCTIYCIAIQVYYCIYVYVLYKLQYIQICKCMHTSMHMHVHNVYNIRIICTYIICTCTVCITYMYLYVYIRTYTYNIQYTCITLYCFRWIKVYTQLQLHHN